MTTTAKFIVTAWTPPAISVPTVSLTKKWCLGPDCCGWREDSIDFHAGYLATWWIE